MRNILVAVLIAAIAQAFVWHLAGTSVTPPDIRAQGLAGGTVPSVSYTPFGPDAEPSPEEVRERLTADMQILSGVTRDIRLYSSRDGIETEVPAIAREFGLGVTAAAWLSDDADANKAEIERVIKLANENWNVRAIYVGNEVLLREELELDELIGYLREVRRRVDVPVTTGEVWNDWIDHPELVREVDFIAAHVLPYWEGVPADQAVRGAFERYNLLRETYPGKKVVIAEFGWPSQGYNHHAADTGLTTQAEIIRAFIGEARQHSVEFNLIEAFDQPWKSMEGSVGAYWGLFDADRTPKFSFTGTVERDLRPIAAGALALGVLLTGLGLRRRKPTFAHAMLYGLTANGFGAGIALAAAYPFTAYLNIGTVIMWVLGIIMVVPLAVMTLAKVNEIGEVLLGPAPRRLFRPAPRRTDADATATAPMVSIHIPAYREPPAMLCQTLDSCADLDYPDYEVLVIVNNTPDEDLWKPVAAHCATLNARLGREVFKYVHLPKVKGFKAGAMNMAYRFTDPRAEVLAVIDADYVVARDWLRDLVPAFNDPNVALVQAPQDHRDGDVSPLKTMMNWEYAGFFDIGMIQRNEDNAIIAHGTMLMLRRSAFDAVGGWATDTIVEDTELGLRLFEAGWTATYTNRRYGWGLLPDTFQAFKTQRHRWAYGAIQIIRKHWRHMLPGSTTLSPVQKSQFLSGWFYWLSDSLGVAVAILNLIWVPVIVLVGMTLPMMALTVPILTAFAVNILHCVLLYRRRVKTAFAHVAGAAVAAMALQLTVANAVMTALVKDNLPFARTDKGGNGKKAGRARLTESPVFWETTLGILLLCAAGTLAVTNFNRITEQDVFAATIAVQAIPFLSATLMRTVEKVQGRLPRLRPGRTPAPQTT